jgi:hypothetical protein
MKTTIQFLCLSACAVALAGCITTKTTVTDPDGTVTVTEYTGPAPGAIEAGVATAGIIAADK